MRAYNCANTNATAHILQLNIRRDAWLRLLLPIKLEGKQQASAISTHIVNDCARTCFNWVEPISNTFNCVPYSSCHHMRRAYAFQQTPCVLVTFNNKIACANTRSTKRRAIRANGNTCDNRIVDTSSYAHVHWCLWMPHVVRSKIHTTRC